MKRKVYMKCLALALAIGMMSGTVAYADTPEQGVTEITQDNVESEIVEAAENSETANETQNDGGVIVDDAEDPDNQNADPANETNEDAETPDNDDNGLSWTVNIPEGVVGQGFNWIDSLPGTKSFSCTSNKDIQYFGYEAEKTGTYRFDVSGTKGRMQFAMLNQDASVFEDWSGVYGKNNAIKVTANLKKGNAYVFAVYPNTNRSDAGQVTLRKTTKDVYNVTVSTYTDRHLNVGPSGAGGWALKSDGTKNFDVWVFGIDEILSLFTADITFTDGTRMAWNGKNGVEVGNTGLIVVPEQIISGWKLGQKAYCRLYLGNTMTADKIEIRYKDPLFKDVRDETHPYYKAIYWGVENGITKGYSDGTFGIDRSCTRGEMVMFLWRFAGKPAPTYVAKSPFKDVPTSHTFYRAILWAYQKGITKGYSDGTFGVNKSVSRGECMMFLWRLKGKPAPKAVAASPFKDVPKTHVFYNAILWGSQKGITKGYTSGPNKGKFGVNDNCTRGQIMTFLYRAK